MALHRHNRKTDTFIEDIHNSEYTLNFRKKFLKGYKPECNTLTKKRMVFMRRMFTNRMYKHLIDYEKALKTSKEDGSTDSNAYWDLRCNLCNLKCVM